MIEKFLTNDEIAPRPGRPKDAVKREDIVIAATELFMEKGYELTSMEAVSRRAGVSKLTIYSHFSDKNELFRAIIQYRCDKMGLPESFSLEAQLPVAGALAKIARMVSSVVFRSDSLRLMRTINAEVLHHPEAVQAFYEVGPRRIKTAFTDLLRDFNRQGKLSVADPVRASEQFFSLLKGERLQKTLLLMAPEPSDEELTEHIEASVAFFLAAYRPLHQKNETTETEKS